MQEPTNWTVTETEMWLSSSFTPHLKTRYCFSSVLLSVVTSAPKRYQRFKWIWIWFYWTRYHENWNCPVCRQMALYLICIFFFPLSCNPQYATLFTFNTEDNVTIQMDKNPHYIWGRRLPNFRPDKGSPDTHALIINCPPAHVHTHLYTKSTPVRRQCQLMFARLLQSVGRVWKQWGDNEKLWRKYKRGTFLRKRGAGEKHTEAEWRHLLL